MSREGWVVHTYIYLTLSLSGWRELDVLWHKISSQGYFLPSLSLPRLSQTTLYELPCHLTIYHNERETKLYESKDKDPSILPQVRPYKCNESLWHRFGDHIDSQVWIVYCTLSDAEVSILTYLRDRTDITKESRGGPALYNGMLLCCFHLWNLWGELTLNSRIGDQCFGTCCRGSGYPR